MMEFLSTIITLAWVANRPSLFRLVVALGVICIDFIGVVFIDLAGIIV